MKISQQHVLSQYHRHLLLFFEGEDYESTILNSIGIGGDCDTVASMAGSIAMHYPSWRKQGIS